MNGLEPLVPRAVIREQVCQDEDDLRAEGGRQVDVLVHVRKLASPPPLAFRENVNDPHRLRVYLLTTANLQETP